MARVRPAAVAGSFYPADPAVLSDGIARMLDEARAEAASQSDRLASPPKALIVPHAGHVYSGPMAARAYACLQPLRDTVRRVVLLGPVHRVPVRGLALPGVQAFATPLGQVPIDAAAVARIAHLPQVVTSPAAHAHEHSLEVQLPFLQRVLADFELVPLAVGDATPDEVAEVLDALWGGPETLIVISSDLSHFLPYEAARARDRDTLDHILRLDGPLDHQQACGGTPINGLMRVAARRRLQPHLLGLCNSGDTAGDKDRVVGYAALAWLEADDARDGGHTDAADGDPAELGRLLISLARQAIVRAVEPGKAASSEPSPPRPAPPARWRDMLQSEGACFITLTQQGELRGCIGTPQAWRPLQDDIEANAVAAALDDPRFDRLRPSELPITCIEVSVLSPLQAMPVVDEADALRQLRPGIDGLVLACGHHRSTFLPQVWDMLPTPAEFLARLKQKAGLAPDFWSPRMQLQRFTVTKWKEGERS
ncbi:MAG: AmmeMemoRadiSam system protein B [Aquabacterium sp.]